MKSILTWLLLLVLVGCVSRRAVRPPPIPTAWAPVERAAVTAAAVQPALKLRGCAWDYPVALTNGVTFEVWSSSDLKTWTLATNTTETIALFPVKQMEFYKVRARDELGQVSGWATVAR